MRYGHIRDEVGKFWVVTRPTAFSTLRDICFRATVPYMMNQCRGGLDENEIVGIYKSGKKAAKKAHDLLKLL